MCWIRPRRLAGGVAEGVLRGCFSNRRQLVPMLGLVVVLVPLLVLGLGLRLGLVPLMTGF